MKLLLLLLALPLLFSCGDSLDKEITEEMKNDGYKYEGGFNYGKYHGQGTYTNSNGTIIKKGLWKNYKYVGE